jgi:adenylate cyclase
MQGASLHLPGEVAQLVEHTTENRGVAGSNPALAIPHTSETGSKMPKEIERKFLLQKIPSLADGQQSVDIEQGYLAIDEETEVRVRRAGQDRFITVKGGQGEVRDEVEIAISEEQFAALWSLTEGRRLSKRRLVVALERGLEVELDVFKDELEGLLIAEVEFESEADSHRFEPPDWLGKEVTGDDRYSGQSLARSGVPAV